MPAGRDDVRQPDLEELAERFGAIGKVFTSLGDPEQAGRVVEALRADEPSAFRELIDIVPDFPGKCLSLCGAIKTLVSEERYEQRWLCRLRSNLTPQERLLAAQIYWRHFGRRPVVVEAKDDFALVTPVIEEWLDKSPYRDELEANNLVECYWKPVLVAPLVGPPSWECIDLCPPPR